MTLVGEKACYPLVPHRLFLLGLQVNGFAKLGVQLCLQLGHFRLVFLLVCFESGELGGLEVLELFNVLLGVFVRHVDKDFSNLGAVCVE